MKKLSILSFVLFILSACPTLLQAQFTLRPQLGLGLAMQTHRFDGDHPREYGLQVRPQAAFELGVLGSYQVAEQLAVQSGLLLHTRGSALVAEEGDRTAFFRITESIRINYLTVPLGVAFQPTAEQPFWLEAGLGLGVALSGRTKTTYLYDDGQDREQDQDRERIDFGRGSTSLLRGDLRFNLGARLQLIDDGIEVGARLSLGLRSIQFDPDDVMRNHGATVFVSLPLEL